MSKTWARTGTLLPCALATVLLAGTAGTASAATVGPDRASGPSGEQVLVLGRDGAESAVAQAVAQAGGKVTRALPIINGVAATIPSGAEGALRAKPGVLSVEHDAAGHLMSVDPALGYDPTADDGSLALTEAVVGARQSWYAGYTGKGVDVALIDSGVSPVPGLTSGNVIYGPDLSFDSQNSQLTDLDGFGHGTHMASIIAGRDVRESGSEYASDTSHFLGLAPDSRLVSVKVAAADGAADVSQVISAINWVDEHAHTDGLNIRVLNLSYGTNSAQSYRVDPLAYAAEQAWKHGIVVVASAGNDGKTVESLADPAYDPNLLAVGASDVNSTLATLDDTVASFTSQGSKTRQVDLVAPGVHALGLRVPGSYVDQSNPSAAVGDRFIRGSGTSQAAAVTTGAVALLVQKYPNATPDQIKQLLLKTATPIKGGPSTGHGELDVFGAETSLLPSLHLKPRPDSVGTGTGSLDAARGGIYVQDSNGDQLTGEQDIFGNNWTPAAWTRAVADKSAWAGGDFNGAVWTGNSFNGGTWSTASWSDPSWTSYSWRDDSWSSHCWRDNAWRDTGWQSGSWGNSSKTTWYPSTKADAGQKPAKPTPLSHSWASQSWASQSWASSSWASSSWS